MALITGKVRSTRLHRPDTQMIAGDDSLAVDRTSLILGFGVRLHDSSRGLTQEQALTCAAVYADRVITLRNRRTSKWRLFLARICFALAERIRPAERKAAGE
jgi:hypothetical protein